MPGKRASKPPKKLADFETKTTTVNKQTLITADKTLAANHKMQTNNSDIAIVIPKDTSHSKEPSALELDSDAVISRVSSKRSIKPSSRLHGFVTNAKEKPVLKTAKSIEKTRVEALNMPDQSSMSSGLPDSDSDLEVCHGFESGDDSASVKSLQSIESSLKFLESCKTKAGRPTEAKSIINENTLPDSSLSNPKEKKRIPKSPLKFRDFQTENQPPISIAKHSKANHSKDELCHGFDSGDDSASVKSLHSLKTSLKSLKSGCKDKVTEPKNAKAEKSSSISIDSGTKRVSKSPKKFDDFQTDAKPQKSIIEQPNEDACHGFDSDDDSASIKSLQSIKSSLKSLKVGLGKVGRPKKSSLRKVGMKKGKLKKAFATSETPYLAEEETKQNPDIWTEPKTCQSLNTLQNNPDSAIQINIKKLKKSKNLEKPREKNNENISSSASEASGRSSSKRSLKVPKKLEGFLLHKKDVLQPAKTIEPEMTAVKEGRKAGGKKVETEEEKQGSPSGSGQSSDKENSDSPQGKQVISE